ncbi:hypothetical protein [Streptomyces sp. RKAG293]|uniref:hypothetical protein n=1 Tax=Streptomyces sp. RKAG293 TaxID=2893403 RepID=UPI00203423A5|nr:hypothetical protein [Streptomyces sp. RKAG293]MCM2424226.1 hypothetical protein [Streptomyces sp. RKAG293]
MSGWSRSVALGGGRRVGEDQGGRHPPVSDQGRHCAPLYVFMPAVTRFPTGGRLLEVFVLDRLAALRAQVICRTGARVGEDRLAASGARLLGGGRPELTGHGLDVRDAVLVDEAERPGQHGRGEEPDPVVQTAQHILHDGVLEGSAGPHGAVDHREDGLFRCSDATLRLLPGQDHLPQMLDPVIEAAEVLVEADLGGLLASGHVCHCLPSVYLSP